MRKANRKTVKRAKRVPATELEAASENMLAAQERLQEAKAAANLAARRKAGYAKVHDITINFPYEVTPDEARDLVRKLFSIIGGVILTQKAAWELAPMFGDDASAIAPADKPK